MRDYLIAKTLAEADVEMAVLLGCNSRALAETAARLTENYVRIAGIEPIRDDNVSDRKLTILNTIIWSYGGRAADEGR